MQQHYSTEDKSKTVIAERETAIIFIAEIYNDHKNDLDVYLKSVVSICRHLAKIENSSLDVNEYIQIFRSQFSVAELNILYYLQIPNSTRKTPLQEQIASYVQRFGLTLDITPNDLIVSDKPKDPPIYFFTNMEP